MNYHLTATLDIEETEFINQQLQGFYLFAVDSDGSLLKIGLKSGKGTNLRRFNSWNHSFS
jgi:hypothetical protein